MLFSGRSLLTMLHGLVLSGTALVLLIVALYLLWVAGDEAHEEGRVWRALRASTTVACVFLWLSVIGGTYVVFPMYRLAPPDGVAALADYPRALLLADPGTAWLHSFAMEMKEHVPWIAAMLVTAAAFSLRRFEVPLNQDAGLRRLVAALLAISIVLVGATALLGVFVNKVAPVW